MNPHEIAEQLQEHLSHAIQQNHAGPPTIRVRLVARLGNNVIDIDQLIPLGAGTPVTIEHIQALACDPFMTLLTRLIECHYRAEAYRLSELPEDA